MHILEMKIFSLVLASFKQPFGKISVQNIFILRTNIADHQKEFTDSFLLLESREIVVFV